MNKETSSYVLFGIDFGSNAEQRELIRQINEDPDRKPVVFCKGAAGTGKTFAALAASLALVRGRGSKRRYKTIFYIREPVEVGHRLGYLKGTEQDKYSPYLGPLLDNYAHLMANAKKEGTESVRQTPIRRTNRYQDDEVYDSPAYQRLPNDIIPLAPEFVRGRSFEDAILIVDEAQNMTLDELQTLVTRLGHHCKMVILGSPNQIDVPDQTPEDNDFEKAYAILEPTGLVDMIELKESMRSGFVAEFDRRFVEYKAAHPNKKKGY